MENTFSTGLYLLLQNKLKLAWKFRNKTKGIFRGSWQKFEIWHEISKNAKHRTYFYSTASSNNSEVFFSQFLNILSKTNFSSVLNKKFQRSDWLIPTMKGEKIITQPWLCQSWRNFIWNFWRFNGQFDAWNQDYFDEI